MKTGNDPRTSIDLAVEGTRPIDLHNPDVSFEEYMYYASITREEEKVANDEYVRLQGPKSVKSVLLGRFSKGHHATQSPPPPPATDSPANEKEIGLGEKSREIAPNGMQVTPAEWKNASRALRTCGWGSIFYLITTDILGPFSTPSVCFLEEFLSYNH